MQELIKKMKKSDGWILLTMKQDDENFNFDADFSSNLNIDDVDNIILRISETAKERQDAKILAAFPNGKIPFSKILESVE